MTGLIVIAYLVAFFKGLEFMFNLVIRVNNARAAHNNEASQHEHQD